MDFVRFTCMVTAKTLRRAPVLPLDPDVERVLDQDRDYTVLGSAFAGQRDSYSTPCPSRKEDLLNRCSAGVATQHHQQAPHVSVSVHLEVHPEDREVYFEAQGEAQGESVIAYRR